MLKTEVQQAENTRGLSSAEVKERLQRGQSNDFEARVGRTYWHIVRDNVFNTFNIVLFSLLLIVMLSRDYATVIFAGFSVVSNTFLGMIQEIHAKRKLDRMASLASKEVRAWRDGRLQVVPIKQIVLDDLIALEPGDRLAVDGRVVESDSLEVDESQITGESDAIFKNAGDSLYSGSFCIAGSGLMVATKVGKDSTVNKLSVIAREFKNILTPTQKKIVAFVELSILAMIILGPMLLVAGYMQNEEPISIVRNAVVFVTSLVPQGLVLVAILALTIGAVKISLKQTLIQRVNAVESLANVTVLCFDKTGTLTQNKLAVTEILPVNGANPDTIAHKLQHYTRSLAYQNRTAGAVAVYVSKSGLLPDGVMKVKEIPFTSSRKWGAVQFPDETLILGAPERLVKDQDTLNKTFEMSSQGMRVLAFARAVQPLPDSTYLNDHVEALALIVMSDQIRHDIGTTLEDFRQLDVALKVVSGDNIETVRAIAGEAGMEVEKAFTGDQLESMDDDELEHAVMEASVFARIEPETKRRIVYALQRRGQYVAMVGDGVNDVPALKAANLAIVMNDGTQISKDVADIVLLNNAMSTLPLAFREGREITQTVFGTMKMFLTKNFYNLLLFMFVAFMMLPFPITPAQISWAAFGTVNMPATFIAFGWMRPKYIEKFRRDALDYMITAGLIGAVAIAVLFGLTYFFTGHDLEITRSSITIFICLFGTVIVWNVQGVEILNPKTFGQHKRVVIISTIATTLTIISFYMFPELFEFEPPNDFRLIALITSLFLLTLVMVDYSMRHRFLLNQLWLLVEKEK